jgi:hypothetical protein
MNTLRSQSKEAWVITESALHVRVIKETPAYRRVLFKNPPFNIVDPTCGSGVGRSSESISNISFLCHEMFALVSAIGASTGSMFFYAITLSDIEAARVGATSANLRKSPVRMTDLVAFLTSRPPTTSDTMPTLDRCP